MQDPHSPPFRGTTYVPGSTVTRPLLDRYSTVTRPLRDRYATVTRPLHTFFMSYRYLPGTWARLCHIASRYLPVALRYKTSIFAYIPRDMYAEGKVIYRHGTGPTGHTKGRSAPSNPAGTLVRAWARAVKHLLLFTPSCRLGTKVLLSPVGVGRPFRSVLAPAPRGPHL
jgi:hypothetical protein